MNKTWGNILEKITTSILSFELQCFGQAEPLTFSSWLLAMAVFLDKLCPDTSAPAKFIGTSL